MAWNPAVALGGDPGPLKVSASDVASNCPCGRYLALKTRPQVRTVGGWGRAWPRDGEETPFPLGHVIDIVLDSHLASGTETYAGLQTWLEARINRPGIHRLMRPYVLHAVENVLEAHEAIEGELGPLSLLRRNPITGPFGRQLWAWAPLYETADGVREIRRLRLGPAHEHQDENDGRWAVTAARVAAAERGGATPIRIRVVEIGCLDGSIEVLWDGSPGEAISQFQEHPQARANAVTEEDHVVPCSSCGDCKTAGTCAALVPLDGLLGQMERGHRSRSISPTALSQYDTCPGQWLMDSCVHLPKDRTHSEAAIRGRAVHEWLGAAHSRGVPCTISDLPEPGGPLGFVAGVLDPEAFALAHPFLRQHIEKCPLSDPEVAAISPETEVRGYDHAAEVAPIARPDLMYRRGDLLILRETKSRNAHHASPEEAFDRHLQIPFSLRLLESGLLAAHGFEVGAVELEVLTATDSVVWTWRTDDASAMAIAAAEVERIADDWHQDATWPTKPGPHCGWCPVQRWCPDAETWEMSRSEAPRGDSMPVDVDAPPF